MCFRITAILNIFQTNKSSENGLYKVTANEACGIEESVYVPMVISICFCVIYKKIPGQIARDVSVLKQ
jgi:hypothetical protein